MEVFEVGVEPATDHGQTPIVLRRLAGWRVRHLRQRCGIPWSQKRAGSV